MRARRKLLPMEIFKVEVLLHILLCARCMFFTLPMNFTLEHEESLEQLPVI
jgi:hypothetical protein